MADILLRSTNSPFPSQQSTYRQIRWQRAISDTEQYILHDLHVGIIGTFAAAIVGALFKYWTGEPREMNVLLFAFLSGLAGLLVTSLLCFLWHFLVAPSRIYVDDQERIAKLEETKVLHTEGLRDDFVEDFNEHAEARAGLWDMLDVADAKYRQTGINVGTVRLFLGQVEFPQDVLDIPQGGYLYDYAQKAHDEWDGERKKFLQFCCALYQQGNSSLLSPQELQRFNGFRQQLAKFWNKWGIRCKNQNISISDIADSDLIQSQTPDVVMLTYLEIAYGLLRKENSRGKQGLFTIAREFRTKSN